MGHRIESDKFFDLNIARTIMNFIRRVETQG